MGVLSVSSILSIQSHVAYGYVGNRSAVFPLQRLGHDVSAINTVQFSNHTGYGSFKGEVFSAEQILNVFTGIAERGILQNFDAVLSGYMGSTEVGSAILNAVIEVRKANPAAIFCCDPVMGDVGRGFFVKPGLPEFIRDEAMPMADILTPNQFELEYLVDQKIETLADALAATAKARALGPKIVLITSLTRNDGNSDQIEMLVDSDEGAFLAASPLIPFETLPNGAGDATSALFLHEYLRTKSPAQALTYALSAIYALLKATKEAGTRELAIISAQDVFANPPQLFTATQVR